MQAVGGGARSFVVAGFLLLVLVGGLPSALAQTSPVLVDRVNDAVESADRGDPALVGFELFNLNPRNDFYVRVSVTAVPQWDSRVAVEGGLTPEGFFLQPRNRTIVTVAFEPLAAQPPQAFSVEFQFVNGDSGEVTSILKSVVVESRVPPLVLGFFVNPLPAPFDTAYGTFALEVLFWVAVALFAIFVGDNIVRIITTRASNSVTREIIQKLRRPVFLFVFFMGLARSFGILPPTAFTGFVARTLVAVAVGVFGLYVLFRVIDSALLYYAQVIAPRTASTIDDILVSLARKFGIAIMWVVGVVYVLKTLGWDPTLVFAGAGIAGLVIAFAAQDTFSNLFSGIFLLLDRPFVEGDDIQLETGEIVRVQSVGLRTTRLYHPRNHESIVLPNNQLATKRVTNLAGPDGRYWVTLEVGVSYASDPRKVERILLDVANANPKLILDEEDWKPVVRFGAFADSSLNFALRCAVRDFRDRFAVASDMRYAIFAAFEAEGIEIPFPQRTVWLHHADADRAAAGAAD